LAAAVRAEIDEERDEALRAGVVSGFTDFCQPDALVLLQDRSYV